MIFINEATHAFIDVPNFNTMQFCEIFIQSRWSGISLKFGVAGRCYWEIHCFKVQLMDQTVKEAGTVDKVHIQ